MIITLIAKSKRVDCRGNRNKFSFCLCSSGINFSPSDNCLCVGETEINYSSEERLNKEVNYCSSKEFSLEEVLAHEMEHVIYANTIYDEVRLPLIMAYRMEKNLPNSSSMEVTFHGFFWVGTEIGVKPHSGTLVWE